MQIAKRNYNDNLTIAFSCPLCQKSKCWVHQIPQKLFSSNIFSVPFLIKNGFLFPTLPTGKMTIYHYAHYKECREGKSGSDWFIQQVSMRALWYSLFNLYSVPVKISPLPQYSLIALLPRIEAITNALKYQGVRQKSQWNTRNTYSSDTLINPHGYLHHLDCYVEKGKFKQKCQILVIFLLLSNFKLVRLTDWLLDTKGEYPGSYSSYNESEFLKWSDLTHQDLSHQVWNQWQLKFNMMQSVWYLTVWEHKNISLRRRGRFQIMINCTIV